MESREGELGDRYLKVAIKAYYGKTTSDQENRISGLGEGLTFQLGQVNAQSRDYP